jgi:hypothetical protein
MAKPLWNNMAKFVEARSEGIHQPYALVDQPLSTRDELKHRNGLGGLALDRRGIPRR